MDVPTFGVADPAFVADMAPGVDALMADTDGAFADTTAIRPEKMGLP